MSMPVKPSAHFPKPPLEKSGWPWNKVSPKYQAKNSKGSMWPKISLVTPSYNQGRFIEETIRSVLLQGYPNLEYIIIDGGSTDQSVDIIRRYKPWLCYWVSEKDNGQADAINKGFRYATGELGGWVNSDDYLLPGGLKVIVDKCLGDPGAVAWAAACNEVDLAGNILNTYYPRVGSRKAFADWNNDAYISQPSCIFRLDHFRKLGGLNSKLQFVLDVDLWTRLAAIGHFSTTNEVVSISRRYEGIKTFQDPSMREAEHIAVCILVGEREIAKKRLEQYAQINLRQNLLNLTWSEFLISFVTKFYRKFFKGIWSKSKRVFSP